VSGTMCYLCSRPLMRSSTALSSRSGARDRDLQRLNKLIELQTHPNHYATQHLSRFGYTSVHMCFGARLIHGATLIIWPNWGLGMANDEQIVTIRTSDGEVVLARGRFISESERDLIYDLISTSRESQYEKHDEQPAYLIKFDDIESVEAPSDDRRISVHVEASTELDGTLIWKSTWKRAWHDGPRRTPRRHLIDSGNHSCDVLVR